jgi:FKBP-type peptidyl-prolyl cis-trans isomerase FklB
VYIPYELAYGISGTTGIPGYSTLVFDITMVDFWSPRAAKK